MTVVEDKDIRTIPWCTIILVALAVTCHTLVFLGNCVTAEMFSNLGDSITGWGSVGLSLSASMNNELDEQMKNTVDYLTNGLQMVMFFQQAIDTLLGTSANSTDQAANLLQDPRMKTHPLILKASPQHEKYRSLLEIGNDHHFKKAKKVELKTVRRSVSQLYFGEIPHDGKVQMDASSFMQAEVVVSGNATKGQMLTWTPENAVPVNTKTLKQTLMDEVEDMTKKVEELADDFLTAIQPALFQVAAWITSMGDKMLAAIDQFSMTIDKVQKIFDQVMSQITGPSIPVTVITENTFNLYDFNHDGFITLFELTETGSMYGITAFAGSKAEQLFTKHDTNDDGLLDFEEYTGLILDPDIPSAGTYTLRQFSEKLSQVGGNIAAGVLRDDVADAMVDYLDLQAVMNRTKVSWICDRLTNQSVVPDLTAAIIKNLAEDILDPDNLTSVPVGQITTDELLLLQPEYTLECFDLFCDPEWWETQGYDSYTQPQLIQIASEWFANSPNLPSGAVLLSKKDSFYSQLLQKAGISAGISLNQFDPRTGSALPVGFAKAFGELAFKEVYKRRKRHEAKARQARIEYHNSVFSSVRAQSLFKTLLGTASFTSDLGVPDADVTEALNSGVPATPATLEFAKFLSWNASQTSKRFEGYAFDYACTSSNALQSFADEVKGMVEKVSGFMNTMTTYSTPRAIKSMEQKIEDFIDDAATVAMSTVEDLLDQAMPADLLQIMSNQPDPAGAMAPQITDKVTAKVGAVVNTTEDVAMSVFSTVSSMLSLFQSILPTVIADLKFAKTEVSAVASVLESVFTNLGLKGAPIFVMVASLYKTLWTVYFILFATLTLTLLFYGFWASGWLGGPSVANEPAPPRATSFKERCIRCCRACNWCMHTCHNTHLCFWSCILFCEIIILVMFIVSIVLAILSGVKVFINVGCAQIYILGDDTVCTSTMQQLQTWLSTFWLTEPSSLDTACSAATLTACKKIMEDLLKSAIFTTVGSFAAALFSFQMLFESASLHEKARWTYLAELEMQK